ncbi:disease resistance protein L6-like [Cornus florida]|uniref:disease resistance protein L6-like n=1 Tax=Cornus florida TaxID=4283 RepID=UPI00289DF2BC|nr:disease resistance protein L6-like [Cornus florida]
MEVERQRTTVSQMECEAGPSRRRTVPVRYTGADADTASHSSSASLPGGAYEVFLSFRGPDTRLGFTDFLYTSLIKSGVRAFRDDEELRKGTKIGPELNRAIRDSRISIPIFSATYAESEWCLRELELMLECNRSSGQLILPIFYHVTPKEVKHQPAGSTYEKAFKKLKESGFSDEAIEQWKKALNEAAHLTGWELKNDAHGHEGKLILEKIVPTVLSELKIKFMKVTRNLVGMDHHENEMTRLFNIASDDVQIVGIHGMSGIGKTTVAKFIYNKLLGYFDCCSFLEDVQTAQKLQGTLVSLQKQLLTDTLNWSLDIANVDDRIASSKQNFRNKKVLIVLDDVNSISQFHRLVGERGCFGKGSKIIVTTKNKGVLNDLNVEWTYELPIMNDAQSLQLFSKHAFNMEFPPEECVSISRKIASTAGGLPLALESIALFISKKDPEIWEDALKKFIETPNDDVGEKLRVDYEALNKEQRQIFLDVACLFSGMDKTDVFYMWDDCGYYPKKEFNGLYLMSLVKVGDANELWMHNQLIALGKKIVNEGFFLGNRSRLWNHTDAFDILEGRMGTEKVEALSLGFNLKSEEKPCFTSEDFTKLVNLRYLQVDGANLGGDFKRVLLSLRWLNWRGCSPIFKPTNFHMKNLVILDLSKSGITEEWGGWNQIKMAKKLKVLQVADCALRRTPNFSSYTPLERLILGRCKSLKYIDPSIVNLKNLKVLDISYSDIRELPDEIWKLKNLEVMDFTECSYLDVNIPSNIKKLSSLRFLSFYGSKIQSLPPKIWRLTQLHTLNIGGCTKLHSQPELPSSLRILNVSDIPNLTNLVNLQELQLFECHNLVMPTNIGKLFKLEKLTFDRTEIKSLPKDIDLLSQLKVLDIRSCDELQCILGLPSSLVELSLAICDSLETLPDLSNMKNLSSLLLKNCNKLAWVHGLGKLESLTSLYIFACEMLATTEKMPNLSNLKKLEILSISNCSKLHDIQGLDKLESLKYLNLRGCENLLKIEGLKALKSLEVLDVSRCTSLETIPILPSAYVRRCEGEIFAADSVYRYWTELRLKKLDLRLPVLSGYRNETTHKTHC